MRDEGRMCETERVSEGKYPPLRKGCRALDERGDGGYLVGDPSYELDVRREKERERDVEGGISEQI